MGGCRSSLTTELREYGGTGASTVFNINGVFLFKERLLGPQSCEFWVSSEFDQSGDIAIIIDRNSLVEARRGWQRGTHLIILE